MSLCNEICLTAADLGTGPAKDVAIADPSCDAHGTAAAIPQLIEKVTTALERVKSADAVLETDKGSGSDTALFTADAARDDLDTALMHLVGGILRRNLRISSDTTAEDVSERLVSRARDADSWRGNNDTYRASVRAVLDTLGVLTL